MKLITKKEQCRTKNFLGKGFKDVYLQYAYLVELDEIEQNLLDKYDFWSKPIDINNKNTENLSIQDLKEGIKLRLENINDIILAEFNARNEADELKKILDCLSSFDKKEIIEY